MTRWTGKMAGGLVPVVVLAAGMLLAAQNSRPEGADAQAAVRQRVESYLRHLYAWGADFTVEVGPLRESALPGLFSTLVRITREGSATEQVILASGDARYLVLGEFHDTAVDPYAQNRANIRTGGLPARGAPGPGAAVTLVEFGDFQCPDCARLHPILKEVLSRNPNVRLVFKHFPLTDIHDWALAAHVAAQCAYEQSNDGFWRLTDYFFEKHREIKADNLDQRLAALAAEIGVDFAALNDCRTEPEAQSAVTLSLLEGQRLGVQSTPTLFINGRPVPGAQPAELYQQIIAYEQARAQQGSTPRE